MGAKYGFETLDGIESTSEIHYLQEGSLRKERYSLFERPSTFLYKRMAVYSGTQIPYTQIEHRKKVFLRLPDKSVVDKQAKEAFDYFVILWKEYLNARYIEDYSQEILADYQKSIQEKAMWANLKSSGKLKDYLMEQFDKRRGRLLTPPLPTFPKQKRFGKNGKRLN